MKSFIFIAVAALLSCVLFAAGPPQLSDVHAVYLMSMGNGLDQFLANRLTSADIFPVVTDPAKADAVFTDKLGEDFQRRLDELYPAPKPTPPAKSAKSDDAQAESKYKAQEELPRATFGRGKGTLFLVDTKTRTVIWSVYEKPKSSSPDDMNRVAGKIADHLKRALAKK